MADGRESERRELAQRHLIRIARKLSEEQVEAVPGILLWLLVDRLSIMDVEQAIDAAAREAKRRNPAPLGAGRG